MQLIERYAVSRRAGYGIVAEYETALYIINFETAASVVGECANGQPIYPRSHLPRQPEAKPAMPIKYFA